MPMTLAELLALLPDNSSGAIGADDMRTVTTELYTQGVVADAVTSVDGEVGAVNLTDNYQALLVPTAIKTGAYPAVARDYVLCDTTTAAFTVTLPTGVPNGTMIGVRLVTSTTPTVTALFVARSGTDVFNKPGGPTSITFNVLNSGAVFQYQTAGGVWQTISNTLLPGDLSRVVWLPVTAPLKTGTYTAGQDEFVPCDTSGAGFTVTLPTAPPDGTMFSCKLVTAGNVLTVARGGTTDLIGKPTTGTTTKTLNRAGQTLLLTYSNPAGVWYEITDVTNTFAAGTNITLDAPSNGVVNVNVDPVAAAVWTPVRVRALADDGPIQSNITIHDDPELVIGSTVFTPNTEWSVELMCIYISDVTAELRWNFSASGAGATFDHYVFAGPHANWPGTANENHQPSYALTIASGDQQAGGFGAAVAGVLGIRGHLVVAATATNLQFQWAQGVTQAINTSRKAGSVMIARRVL